MHMRAHLRVHLGKSTGFLFLCLIHTEPTVYCLGPLYQCGLSCGLGVRCQLLSLVKHCDAALVSGVLTAAVVLQLLGALLWCSAPSIPVSMHIQPTHAAAATT